LKKRKKKKEKKKKKKVKKGRANSVDWKWLDFIPVAARLSNFLELEAEGKTSKRSNVISRPGPLQVHTPCWQSRWYLTLVCRPSTRGLTSCKSPQRECADP